MEPTAAATAPEPPKRESFPVALVRLVRVKHWLKNVFVLAPALFSERIFERAVLFDAIAAFGAFCLLSSALYVTNDIKDRREDALHPRKRRRPIASGRFDLPTGILIAIALAAGSFAWSLYELDVQFLIPLAAYAANTVAYIVWLKYRVIVDVIMIACGFVLRLLAGCVAVHV